MPRAAAAIPLLDACARVEMIAAADTACHQPRRGHGGPPNNLGSAGDGAGAEHARQERPLEAEDTAAATAAATTSLKTHGHPHELSM